MTRTCSSGRSASSLSVGREDVPVPVRAGPAAQGPEAEATLSADDGVAEHGGAQRGHVDRVLAAPWAADGVRLGRPAGDGRRRAGGAHRHHLERSLRPQPPAHERVTPDARRALGREALVQRLRAARVIRDRDEQLHARRGRCQELQLRQERRAPLVLLRRHERIHQQQRLTRYEGVGLDLFGLRPPLRVRRRPPVDASGQLVHLVLLGAPSSYRCLVPSRAPAIPSVRQRGPRRPQDRGVARREEAAAAARRRREPVRPRRRPRLLSRSRPIRSRRCGCARTAPGSSTKILPSPMLPVRATWMMPRWSARRSRRSRRSRA